MLVSQERSLARRRTGIAPTLAAVPSQAVLVARVHVPLLADVVLLMMTQIAAVHALAAARTTKRSGHRQLRQRLLLAPSPPFALAKNLAHGLATKASVSPLQPSVLVVLTAFWTATQTKRPSAILPKPSLVVWLLTVLPMALLDNPSHAVGMLACRLTVVLALAAAASSTGSEVARSLVDVPARKKAEEEELEEP